MIHLRTYLKNFIVYLIVGFVCYVSFFANMLTNQYDGLWIFSFYISWDIELPSGRWMLPFMDRLRYGYAGDPFSSYLALIFFAAGTVLLMDLMDVVQKRISWLLGSCVMVCSTVLSVLSYRFASSSYALSYALSILAVWLVFRIDGSVRTRRLCCAGMTVAVTLSLGMYQMNLGITCFLVVICLIRMLLAGRSYRDTGIFFTKSVVFTAAGMVIYKIIWDAVLRITGLEISAYKGGGNVSVGGILSGLPGAVILVYKTFFGLLHTTSVRFSMFQPGKIYQAMIFLVIAMLCFLMIRLIQNDLRRGLLCIVLLFLVPAAVFVVYIITPDAGELLIHMTTPVMVMAPVFLALLLTDDALRLIPRDGFLRYMVYALSVLIIYGRIYQTAGDLTVMMEGQKATETLIGSAVHTLISDGYYQPEDIDDDTCYFFVGRPGDNPMFQKPALWNGANDEARYGEFWVDESMRLSYQGVLKNLGYHMNAAYWYDEYIYITSLEEVQKMPLYPAEGSIRRIDGYVVIKISDIP